MRAVIVSAAVAFLVSIFGTPLAIRAFTRLKVGQPIRAEGPQSHQVKKGTPTMGGVVFIVATLIAYVAGHFVFVTLPARQLGAQPSACVVVDLRLSAKPWSYFSDNNNTCAGLVVRIPIPFVTLKN